LEILLLADWVLVRVGEKKFQNCALSGFGLIGGKEMTRVVEQDQFCVGDTLGD
jgi:hypothetical protein